MSRPAVVSPSHIHTNPAQLKATSCCPSEHTFSLLPRPINRYRYVDFTPSTLPSQVQHLNIYIQQNIISSPSQITSHYALHSQKKNSPLTYLHALPRNGRILRQSYKCIRAVVKVSLFQGSYQQINNYITHHLFLFFLFPFLGKRNGQQAKI